MKNSFMESFGKLVLSFAILAGSIILKGFVISKLWEWIIVPIFNMSMISIVEGIGIGLIVGFITKLIDVRKIRDAGDWDEFILNAFTKILYYLFVLGFGWLLTLWIN